MVGHGNRKYLAVPVADTDIRRVAGLEYLVYLQRAGEHVNCCVFLPGKLSLKELDIAVLVAGAYQSCVDYHAVIHCKHLRRNTLSSLVYQLVLKSGGNEYKGDYCNKCNYHGRIIAYPLRSEECSQSVHKCLSVPEKAPLPHMAETEPGGFREVYFTPVSAASLS